jgi:hypothetical protein
LKPNTNGVNTNFCHSRGVFEDFSGGFCTGEPGNARRRAEMRGGAGVFPDGDSDCAAEWEILCKQRAEIFGTGSRGGISGLACRWRVVVVAIRAIGRHADVDANADLRMSLGRCCGKANCDDRRCSQESKFFIPSPFRRWFSIGFALRHNQRQLRAAMRTGVSCGAMQSCCVSNRPNARWALARERMYQKR